MFKNNMNLNVKISTFHTTRLFFLLVLHIVGASVITVFLIFAFSYLGYVGELSSAGLLFL
jgi:hypothetical protein